MATTTARMLQSFGLAANIGQIAARELGLTSDTERPVIGTSGAGAKYIGTEDFVTITSAAPSPLAISKRSKVNILVDTGTAGADVSLDITAGAQIAGYELVIFVSGPETRRAIINYASGKFEYITANESQRFIWSGSAWIITKQTIKTAVEYGKTIGELFTNPEYKSPAVWNPSTPETYFPAVCLTDFATNKDISDANYPDLGPWLRNQKIVFKQNITGQITDPVVTNWAIAANVATLTFQNDADHIAFLAALLEDELLHGSYTNWRTITLAVAIGSITSGTYALTNVNASSRTVSFNFTASNGSGAVTSSASFYAYRIPGSTTTARLFSLRGLSIHGPSDDNGYMLNGLRRRGYAQSHIHPLKANTDGSVNETYPRVSAGVGNTVNITFAGAISPPTSDGTNGTPRTAKETNSPLQAAHIYQHARRYLP